MNRQRLEFATAGFLMEMRRQWSLLHPGEPCPVKNLSDYPEKERSALMSAVQKGVVYAGPTADKAYDAWAKKRAEAHQPEAV